MVVYLKSGISRKDKNKIISFFKNEFKKCSVKTLEGILIVKTADVRGLSFFAAKIEAMDGVDKTEMPLYEACPSIRNIKKTDIEFLKKDFSFIVGPCAVENETLYLKTAKKLKELGAAALRAQIFKPRKSPYSFQGVGLKGLEILKKVKKETGLFLITEITDTRQIEKLYPYCDAFQIGAGNMRNYELLKEAGRTEKPIMIKRAAGASFKEWALSAEYSASCGNKKIILCERGDVPFLGRDSGINLNIALKAKKFFNLPVIIDVSHSSGGREFVAPLAKAAFAVGFDGIMAEVYARPDLALVDGRHTLNIKEFKNLIGEIKKQRRE